MSGWVYILTNKPNGVLYTGVTAKLAHRIWDHRNGQGGAFTRRYKLKRLVYVEEHVRIEQAIQREALIKSWPRAWKVRLITSTNPDWNDLYEHLIGL
jgi:putative endonuclease